MKPTIPKANRRGISPVSSRLPSGTEILYLPRPAPIAIGSENAPEASDLPKGRYNRKPRGRAIGELYRLKKLGLTPINSHQSTVTLENADAMMTDVKAAGFEYFVVPIPPMGLFKYDEEKTPWA